MREEHLGSETPSRGDLSCRLSASGSCSRQCSKQCQPKEMLPTRGVAYQVAGRFCDCSMMSSQRSRRRLADFYGE
jgi:hypothetical protein